MIKIRKKIDGSEAITGFIKANSIEAYREVNPIITSTSNHFSMDHYPS
ncbi:hypothetical protein ABE426_04585 [Sphingobacterium faecium]